MRHPARFVVRHYAGPVEYASDGFLDKNNDTMSDDLVGLFAASHSPFLKSLFPSRDEMARTRKVTLGGQFQEQLADLMVSLERTHPHYIRCVKPNADKRAGAYTAPMVHEQLRYSGVYEAVAIRKRGYPFRYEHGAFAQRYLCAVPGARLAALRRASPVDQCRAIIGAVQLDDDLREHIQVRRRRRRRRRYVADGTLPSTGGAHAHPVPLAGAPPAGAGAHRGRRAPAGAPAGARAALAGAGGGASVAGRAARPDPRRRSRPGPAGADRRPGARHRARAALPVPRADRGACGARPPRRPGRPAPRAGTRAGAGPRAALRRVPGRLRVGGPPRRALRPVRRRSPATGAGASVRSPAVRSSEH